MSWWRKLLGGRCTDVKQRTPGRWEEGETRSSQKAAAGGSLAPVEGEGAKPRGKPDDQSAGSAKRVQELVSALEPDIAEGRFGICDDFEKCLAAVDKIAEIGEGAIPNVVKRLPVSSFAHAALAQIGGDRVFQILCQELNSSAWERITAAAQALGQMGDARALGPLKAARSAIAWCDVINVHTAVDQAISSLERAQGDSFFSLDRTNPYGQVKKMWDETRQIVRDEAAREKAIAWYRGFVSAMPDLSFQSDFERAHTWFCLGVIAFRLLHPEPNGLNALQVDGPCEDAALCLRKCVEILPEEQKHRISSLGYFLEKAEQPSQDNA